MYEVYALKYGERDTTACQFFYREASHAPITLHYYVWLILGGPHPILVDTGFLDDDARERGIRNYVSPAAMVERAGVKPGDVPIALITHLHYDHWAGHSLFPNAEYWIQRDEVAFWTGPFGRYPAFGQSANVGALARLVTLTYANRVRIIDGDRDVLSGIRVHRGGVGNATGYCRGEKAEGKRTLFSCVSSRSGPPGGGQTPCCRASSRTRARWSRLE